MSVKEELMKLSIESYDKGIDDCCDTIKGALLEMKNMGFKALTIDQVIEMIGLAKETANKIPSTFNKNETTP